MFAAFRDYNSLFRVFLEFDEVDKEIAHLIIEN